MLEDQVAFLLQKYLGNYVLGLSKEALKISVWQGDVELTNMQLKPEALNALKLPVKVKAGFLGSVKLKVPWSRIGQDPVLVSLDRIFLLAEPATQVEGSSEDSVQEVKKTRIREMEMKLLESKQILTNEMNKSWLGSFINTIIGNLKLSISNIHIRYEDIESNPGHPFAAAVTLKKLSAVTVDDKGKETFISDGALNHIRKSIELEELAVYLDSDIIPWHINKPWKELLPFEWSQVFKYGAHNGEAANELVRDHNYILQPVTGNANYSKRRPDVAANSGQPLQKALVYLDDVTLCLSKTGYRDLLKLADNFAAFNQRLKYAHYRPLVSVKSDPRSWWRYACRVISEQMKKASGKLSWDQVSRYASMRKKYISLYASLLKSDTSRAVVDDNSDIENMDRELDIELIIQWRMLAHKYVEQSMESDLNLKKQKAKKSWWSIGWDSQSANDGNEPGSLTVEDWEQLNNMIGYKEGDDTLLAGTHDKGDVLHTSLEVHMKHNASKLTDDQECLAELSSDNLGCLMKFYSETKIFDLKLGSYRLSSPNGLLAESATAYDSLLGVFCYKPFDVEVDWSMVAKASPCYVTYLKDSVDQIVNFFESSAAVTQTVALETAAAVQMTIDEVRRTAQEQVNKAMKDQTRFLLDLDIAAPKITIPTDFCPDKTNSTKLLLDLGHLFIRTRDESETLLSDESNMYLQFDLVLSDVAAFLVDGDYHWSQSLLKSSARSFQSGSFRVLPVIDKCRLIVNLQQIRLENPSYPSTRIALRLPSLGFHFSPARYHRLMQVVKIFQADDSKKPDIHRPWDQADFEGWLSILGWKGVGSREAVWKRRYLCLVGPFLYILEKPGSRSYKQYISVRGRQLYQVPANIVGNVEHVLAVCDMDKANNKVVEDANALILRCESEESRRIWQSRLQGAIYRASVDVPLEVVHLTDEYWSNVVSYIIEEYRCGRTANPDVLCNTRIKFGAFMDAISNMGFDFVASGHYAKVIHNFTEQTSGSTVLQLSEDMVKDQTYFLSHLSQSQLRRLLFPLGCIPKDIVRQIAKNLDLPNKERKDSQGICFLGKIKFSDFVARHIGETEGVILEAETGDFLGNHRGFWFYTIGQRQGLRLPGGPWYVVEKDTKHNVVYVSRSYFSVDKRRRSFRVGSLKWLCEKHPNEINHLRCKVRHGPGFYDCSLTMEPGESTHDKVAVVQLSEDDQGLAAGQFAAFYDEKTCLGSGVILESWDDSGFPICPKALEIAKMEDKSKLGKPVKIKVKPSPTIYDTNENSREANQYMVDSKSAISAKRRPVEHQKKIQTFPFHWLQQFTKKWMQIF